MFGWNRTQVQPIGVDIGHDSVKMLQLEVKGRSLVVRASARRQLEMGGTPPAKSEELIPPHALRAVRDLVGSGVFSGHSAVLALPRQIVQVKNLRLPQMPVSELAAVVRFEAKNVFTFDGAEARIDFLHAGEVRQGQDIRQEVIVLAARHSDVDRYLEQLHQTGLTVDSLDAEPCALYRGVDRFVRRREDEQEVHVLIDLGMKCGQVLIGKGREISFFKLIEIGGADLNLAVSRKLGISPDDARTLRRRLWSGEEAGKRDPVRQAVLDATRSTMENLAREISLCMRYHSVTFRGQRAARVRLLGGEAGDPQLLAILNSTLSVPVETGRPLFSVDCRVMRGFDGKGKASGEWALALGLSLKRTEGRFAPLDGTPRRPAPALPPTAEVIDLTAAIAPIAANKDAPSPEDHFAAVRRAAVGEAAHA